MRRPAFNDSEFNRTGVAAFMTEQQARENELRGTQAIVENGTLAVMTAFNRVGCYRANSHTGLMIDILREEWGFKDPISEDFIQSADYAVLKEAVMNGVTMVWQAYAPANSNALDGMSSNSHLETVRTWYDGLLTAMQVCFAILTIACAVMYYMSAKRKDNHGSC